MANRRMEFLIGMTVLVIFAAVAIMTILFGPERGLMFRGSGQRMTIVFEKANGITNNSRVMKSGVEIGRVYKRELLDQGNRVEVRVDFELNPGVKIYTNEYARISRTILGDAEVEFIKNPAYQGNIVEVRSGDEIVGAAGGDLQSTVSNIEGDLAKALQKVTEAASGLTLFMENLNTFLGTPDELNEKKVRLQNIFNELNDTLVSVRNMTDNVNTVVSDKEVQDSIRKGAASIPSILEKVDNLMTNANSLTDDFRNTIDRSHRTFDNLDSNLDNVSRFTTALAEQGPDFIGSLSESSKDIREMVGNIAALADDLKQSMGDHTTPLGMLNDPAVGSSLRGILHNAEEISLKLQPVVDNAEVFTNKIAHKPSSLLWGGTNYKGYTPSPSGNQSAWNYQSLSPTGGLSSSLYRPSDTSGQHPDSLDAIYARYPEDNRSKSGFSLLSGFSGGSASGKTHCSLFQKKNKDPGLDMDHYYTSADGQGDGTMSTTDMMDAPTGTETRSEGRFGFSLKKPMGGLLRSRQEPLARNEEVVVPGGVYYVGTENGEGELAQSYPSYADASNPNGSRPMSQASSGTPLTGREVARSLPARSVPDAGGTEVLPATVLKPVTPRRLPRPETDFVDDGLPMVVMPDIE